MTATRKIMDFDFIQVAKTADVKSIWRKGFNFRRAETKKFNAAKKIAFVIQNPKSYRKFMDGKRHSMAAVIVKLGFSFEPVSMLDIEKGVLSSYDVVWFPGGFGYFPNKITAEILRKFIASGKGYIGICAGAFLPLLPTKGVLWKGCKSGLGLLPVTYDYFRETGKVQVNFKPNDPVGYGLQGSSGKIKYALYHPPKVARQYTARVSMLRGNGPLMITCNSKAKVIGYYDGNKPYAAVVRGQYGLGRIVVFSAHPDAYVGDIARFASPADAIGNLKMVKNAILYCGGFNLPSIGNY